MKSRASLLLCFGLLALAGCAEDPDGAGATFAQEQPEQTAFRYVQLAPSPPPEAVQEMVPENYQPMKQIWRPGFWQYDNMNFEWVPGQFIDRPSPTAVWEPARWERHKFGWAFVPGRWR